MKNIEQVEVTKISSKGQLVIPKDIRIRLKIKEGSMFAIASCDNTLVLKKIESPIVKEDMKTIKRVEEAWNDIAKGRYRKLSKESFLKEIERW